MRHVNAKILRLALGLFAPNRSQQLAMRDDFSGVLNEDTKKRIFGWRKFDLSAGELDLARRKIDAERTGRENRFTGFGERTSLHDTEAREQFRGIERFRNVIVRTRVERGDFFLAIIADGKNQHRYVRPFAQTPEHFNAFHVGQTEIEQDHVGSAMNDFVETALSGFSFVNLMVGAFEREPEQAANLFFVIDDQRRPSRFHQFASNVFSSVTRTRTSMTNRAPPPSRFSAVSLPPCASTNPRAIASPKPSPPARRPSPR